MVQFFLFLPNVPLCSATVWLPIPWMIDEYLGSLSTSFSMVFGKLILKYIWQKKYNNSKTEIPEGGLASPGCESTSHSYNSLESGFSYYKQINQLNRI